MAFPPVPHVPTPTRPAEPPSWLSGDANILFLMIPFLLFNAFEKKREISSNLVTICHNRCETQHIHPCIGQAVYSLGGHTYTGVIFLICTLCVHYVHGVANLNCLYSEYAKVTHMHYKGSEAEGPKSIFGQNEILVLKIILATLGTLRL